MKLTKREQKIIGIGGIIIIGTAFIFFVMGIMFTTYNHIQLLGNINVDEINMDINETLIVELSYKIAKQEQKSDYEKANDLLWETQIYKPTQ